MHLINPRDRRIIILIKNKNIYYREKKNQKKDVIKSSFKLNLMYFLAILKVLLYNVKLSVGEK